MPCTIRADDPTELDRLIMEAASRAPLELSSDDGPDMPSAPTPPSAHKADDTLPPLEPLPDEADPAAAILGLSDDLALMPLDDDQPGSASDHLLTPDIDLPPLLQPATQRAAAVEPAPVATSSAPATSEVSIAPLSDLSDLPDLLALEEPMLSPAAQPAEPTAGANAPASRGPTASAPTAPSVTSTQASPPKAKPATAAKPGANVKVDPAKKATASANATAGRATEAAASTSRAPSASAPSVATASLSTASTDTALPAARPKLSVKAALTTTAAPAVNATSTPRVAPTSRATSSGAVPITSAPTGTPAAPAAPAKPTGVAASGATTNSSSLAVGTPPMDRDFIARNQIVERYISGKLPIRGATDFEKFCAENPELLDELGLPARVNAGLRLLEAAGKPEPWQEPAKKFWEKPYLAIALGVATIALSIALTVVAGHSSDKSARIAKLEKQVADQPLNPATSTRTVRLLPSYKGGSNSPAVILGGPKTQLADLKIDLSRSSYRNFRVTIDRIDQGRVAILHNLAKDSNGHLNIALNTSALGPGNYQFTLEGITWKGQVEPEAWITIGITH